MSNQTTDLQTTTPTPAAPAAAYLAGLRTDVSRASMLSELNKVARLMGAPDWRAVNWSTLNAANVMAVMAQVDGAPSTRNKTLSALKGVARAAWRMGLVDSESLARIADVKGDSGSRELAGREIEGWEIAALMRACSEDPTPAGARDAALIGLAVKTGARREELCKLSVSSLIRTNDGAELRTIGKRNKERPLFIDNGALQALDDWLKIRGLADGPIFCAVSQIGLVDTDHQVTTTALHQVLHKRAAEAGLSNLTWHDFRRTFASNLLDAGADIAIVAGMMGHSSVTTTARYDRRPAAAKRRAALKISVPYFARKGI